VTNSCNLSCSYCFADSSINIKEKASFEIAEKFIDKIYSYWLSLESKNKVIIEFTGGEPLLNFPVIKHTVEYCNAKVRDDIGYFEFVIQTNLISLTAEIIQFFVDNKVGIGTSCDGFDQLNDEQRMLSNKNGSHSIFVEKLDLVRRMAPNECRSVITVITEKNVKYMPEIFLYLTTLGFIEVNFRPVSEIGRGHRIMEIDEFSLAFSNGLFDIFENIIFPYLKDSGVALHEGNVERTFQNLFTPYRPFMCERSPCGAAKNICITMPNGDIYPCNQSTSEEMNTKLGNVLTDEFENIFRQSITLKYAERKTEAIEECKKCVFRHWCGSPCPQEGILKKGSFIEKSSDCEIMKNRNIAAFKTLLSNEEYIKVLGSLTKINENSLQWSQFKMY
jgi:uncharacterized protein